MSCYLLDITLDPDAPYVVIEHYQVNGQPLVVWFENGVVKQVRQFGVNPATSQVSK